MKVKFKATWFGPGINEANVPDKQSSTGQALPGTGKSGVRYKKGVVYELPDDYVKFLPRHAEIIEGRIKGKKVTAQDDKDGLTLKEFDNEREVAKRMEEILNRAGA
jgi:hypothetical protein